MNEHMTEGGTMEDWEMRLQAAARRFPYPPTPDLAGAVRTRLVGRQAGRAPRWRGLAWAALILLVVLAGLLAVPSVRAAVLRALRLGAVEILLEPTPAPTLSPHTTTPAEQPTPSPQPEATLLPSLLDLAGRTTLAEARERVEFPLRLPAHPPDLGHPDHVFLQPLGGPWVAMVWLDREQPGRVRLSLHEFGHDAAVWKMEPDVVQETTVHGERAYWTDGPYIVTTRNGGEELRRLVDGHVLIWTEGEITYRLETDLPLAEAVRIAESLQ